jgi:DNA-binding response OmpR family regulator
MKLRIWKRVKVLFLGNFLLAQRVISALTNKEIEVTYLTDTSLAIIQIKQKYYDFVIVDSSLEKVEEICYEICGVTKVPVVIMVDEAETSWKAICNIDADGFVTTDASDTEILARVKALYKRFAIKSQSARVS